MKYVLAEEFEVELSPEVTNGLFAIGGAIAGAIIGGLFAIYVAKKSRDKKEIVISTSHPSRLLVIHDQIATDVEIKVSGIKVDNVILSEIFISKTGNVTVEKLEFPVSCQESANVLSVAALDQESDTPRVGSFINYESQNSFNVQIDYVNPGEEISLRSVVGGDEPSWTVGLRQSGLNVVQRQTPVASYSDVVGEVLFESLAGISILRTYLRITSPLFRKYLENRSK